MAVITPATAASSKTLDRPHVERDIVMISESAFSLLRACELSGSYREMGWRGRSTAQKGAIMRNNRAKTRGHCSLDGQSEAVVTATDTYSRSAILGIIPTTLASTRASSPRISQTTTFPSTPEVV